MLATAIAGTPTSSPPFFSRQQTAALIDFADLVRTLRATALDKLHGRIHCPERISVPLQGDGISLSMPASAADVSIHKLVNVQPANAQRGISTIQGVVTVCDVQTGEPIMFLDGPEVTGRRTAGISLLAIQTFVKSGLKQALLIGTGMQATYHVAALRALYPSCEILVRGNNRAKEDAFCSAQPPGTAIKPCPAIIPKSVQVVIALTTSKVVVYDETPRPERLVIGAGAFKPDMAEIGPRALQSDIYADDVEGARHEAGDLLRANIDWNRVRPLAQALNADGVHGPVVVKSVGSAAWDLAAARVALASFQKRSAS